MTGSHIAGGGTGALIGVVLVALGRRIGFDLTNVDSATLGLAAVGLGTGVGHALGHAGGTVGVFPALRRFLFGPPKPKATPVAPAPVPEPAPTVEGTSA